MIRLDNTAEINTFFPCQVEDSWKTIEFIVLPHRDAKDIFILGGTDDIQVGKCS